MTPTMRRRYPWELQDQPDDQGPPDPTLLSQGPPAPPEWQMPERPPMRRDSPPPPIDAGPPVPQMAEAGPPPPPAPMLDEGPPIPSQARTMLFQGTVPPPPPRMQQGPPQPPSQPMTDAYQAQQRQFQQRKNPSLGRQIAGAAISIAPRLRGVGAMVSGEASRERDLQNLQASKMGADEEQQVINHQQDRALKSKLGAQADENADLARDQRAQLARPQRTPAEEIALWEQAGYGHDQAMQIVAAGGKLQPQDKPPAQPPSVAPGHGVWNAETKKYDIPVPAPDKPATPPSVAPGHGVWNPDTQKYDVPVPAAEKPDSGTWTLQESADGKPVLLNSRTGETKPAPNGVQRSGTADKKNAAIEKEQGPTKAALDYATNYVKNGVYTGSGDEALQEKFFELAKPSVGFRMTQPQMDMLQNSRGWMGSLAAKARHATTGTWFDDEQRNQIVRTMNDLAKAKLGSGGSTPGAGREQHSPSTGQYRYSLDGGQTWLPGRLPQK